MRPEQLGCFHPFPDEGSSGAGSRVFGYELVGAGGTLQARVEDVQRPACSYTVVKDVHGFQECVCASGSVTFHSTRSEFFFRDDMSLLQLQGRSHTHTHTRAQTYARSPEPTRREVEA